MQVLLVHPRSPKTFWSFDAALALVGRQALLPPLGLITVAALLPPHWDLRLVDTQIREVSEEEWRLADLVIFHFIGNRRNVRLLLPVLLQQWQRPHDFPFAFTTEASLDQAADEALMTAMTACRFGRVFLGIETADECSLVSMARAPGRGRGSWSS